MVYVLLVIALLAAGYFGLRYYLLRKSFASIDKELEEISKNMSENRIVRLSSPDQGVEQHLTAINTLLGSIRREFIRYDQKEDDLKRQIEYISHDLRTPLTAIQGYLSLIDTEDLDEVGTEAYETIQRKTNSLERLIVQFYEISSLSNEARSFNLQVCDLTAILRETLTEHYLVLSERNLAIALSIPDEPQYVLSNPDALKRIIANLLENAGRYAYSKVFVEARQDKGRFKLIFCNDTKNLNQTDLEDIFKPFYVKDKSRTPESTGLGLAIVHRLAEAISIKALATLEEKDNVQTIQISLSLPCPEVL